MQNNTFAEIKEKNKIYKSGKKRKFFIVGAVIIIYCFFFLSSFILPAQRTDPTSITKIGKEVAFAENRTVTLTDATYSRDQEIMEIVLHFTNNNYDNVNDYYYTLTLAGASTKGIIIDEIYNEDLFTVLRIKDVPKNYIEMNLLFAPKTVEESQITDEITGSVILNKYNVKEDQIDLNKSRTAYLTERMDSVIAKYEQQLERQQRKLEELNATKAALLSENDEFQKNKKFMTEQEIIEKELVIIDNEDKLLETEEEIRKQENKIAKTKEEIAAAKEKKNNISW